MSIPAFFPIAPTSTFTHDLPAGRWPSSVEMWRYSTSPCELSSTNAASACADAPAVTPSKCIFSAASLCSRSEEPSPLIVSESPATETFMEYVNVNDLADDVLATACATRSTCTTASGPGRLVFRYATPTTPIDASKSPIASTGTRAIPRKASQQTALPSIPRSSSPRERGSLAFPV